jgi:hypothetical protein
MNPETTIKPNLYNMVMKIRTKTIMKRSDNFMVNETISTTNYSHMSVKMDVVAAHFRFLIKNVVHRLSSFL